MPRNTQTSSHHPEAPVGLGSKPQNVTPHPAKPLLGRGFCAAWGGWGVPNPMPCTQSPPQVCQQPSSRDGDGEEHGPGTPKPPTKAEPRRALRSPSHPPWGQARGGGQQAKGGWHRGAEAQFFSSSPRSYASKRSLTPSPSSSPQR